MSSGKTIRQRIIEAARDRRGMRLNHLDVLALSRIDAISSSDHDISARRSRRVFSYASDKDRDFQIADALIRIETWSFRRYNILCVTCDMILQEGTVAPSCHVLTHLREVHGCLVNDDDGHQWMLEVFAVLMRAEDGANGQLPAAPKEPSQVQEETQVHASEPRNHRHPKTVSEPLPTTHPKRRKRARE